LGAPDLAEVASTGQVSACAGLPVSPGISNSLANTERPPPHHGQRPAQRLPLLLSAFPVLLSAFPASSSTTVSTVSITGHDVRNWALFEPFKIDLNK
jgi:hypothetical protein